MKRINSNVKNSQYYIQVIQELKEQCNGRNEEFCYDVNQTRQKFKCCVTLCRNAVMKVKTASGIKRFQEDKGTRKLVWKVAPSNKFHGELSATAIH